MLIATMALTMSLVLMASALVILHREGQSHRENLKKAAFRAK